MMLLLNGDIRLVNALDSSSHGRPLLLLLLKSVEFDDDVALL